MVDTSILYFRISEYLGIIELDVELEALKLELTLPGSPIEAQNKLVLKRVVAASATVIRGVGRVMRWFES